MQDRPKQIIRASWISIIGNTILSVSKIAIGLIAGSLAVIGDGVDSASDVIISVITLFAARLLVKPPDPKFPFGYDRIDTIVSKALSFVIFFAGAQLAISTIENLLDQSHRELPSMLAIYVTLFSIAGKLILSLYQFRIGKKVKSSMLLANARNMQNDVIISVTVLTGLIFTMLFKLPWIDMVTALAVSIWIMNTAYRIFMKSNVELMDGVEDPTIYNDIFKAIACIKGVYNAHRLRIRKVGHQYIVDLDVQVEGTKTVTEAHRLSKQVEKMIKKRVDDIYDVVIRVEPYGLEDKDEKYGVSNIDAKK